METWDRYASDRPHRRLVNATGERTWFNWTQYPDHGPGIEVLSVSPGARMLDLGCGKGGNLAHVAAVGCDGVGVDISPVQIKLAHERWPDLDLHCTDAFTFLEAGSCKFDAIYSVFGAMWFVDPDLMLPAIHRRLHGTLAFSYTDMNAVSAVPRWDFEPEEWALKLDKHGFSTIETREIEPPRGLSRGTVVIRATSA